jgi:autotransporter-associated beta strand protein
MKRQNVVFVFRAVFILGLCGMLPVAAQTNFWWTNNVSGGWNAGANWTNDALTGLPPNAGGSNDFGLVFQNTGAVTTTNNSGAPNFILNQLQFAAGAVTIYGGAGTSLVFATSTGGVLPQLLNTSANGGTLNIAVVLGTNLLFGGAGTGALLVNSNLSGAGGLTMGGAYTLTLNASNSYGGGTVITNGTVKVGNVGAFTNYWAFGTNRTITVSGAGTLDLNNASLATNYNIVISGAGVGGNGAIVNSGTGMTAGFTNLTLAGDAVIGGAQRWDVRNFSGLGLVNLNGFTLTKKGANTISFVNDLITDGNIAVNAGLLSFEGTTVATGGVGAVTINSGGTFYLYSTVSNNITRPIVANGGILQLGSGTGSANSPVLLQSNVNLNVAGNYILNGPITESGGAYAVNKTGTAGVTLNGLNTFSGGLAISGGVVSVSISENLGSYTGLITVANNSLLQVNGTELHNLGLHALANANGFNGGVDVGSAYNAFVISSNLSGSGKMTKAGLGLLVLQGTNSYTGGTLNTAGMLRLTGGNNALAAGGALTNAGGTLDFNGSTLTLSNVLVMQGGTIQNGTIVSTVSNYDARAGVLAANLQGGVGLVKTTTGTLALLGNNTYTGGTTLSTGTLAIASDANIGTLNFAGGMLQILGSGVDLTAHGIGWNTIPFGSGFDIANTGIFQLVTSVIGGSSSLTKAGVGALVLTAPNTYSGPTIINAGTLRVGNGGASGTLGTGNVTNNGGAGALVFNRTDTLLVTNTIVGNGGLYIKSGVVVFSNSAVSLGAPNNASYVGNAVGDVATLIVAGNAVLSGSASAAAGGLFVGNNGLGTLIVKDNANVSQRLGVGGAAGSVGAVYQLGGVVTTLGGSGIDAGVGGYYNGGAAGAYGYYGLNSGILTNSQYFQVGALGLGVLYNLGGSMVEAASSSQPLEISRSGTGVVFFAGNSTYSSPNNIEIGGGSGSANGVAYLTVAGNAAVAAGQLQMGATSQRLAILNLDGGVLQVSQITKNNAATFGLVNFDGGTLRATTNGNLFNIGANAPNGAYVYGGGVVLDSSNFNVNVAQNLSAPAGSGVVSVAFGGPLAGYAGAPLVNITGGGGTGATAIAQFDYATLSVTGLLITSHGYGYTTAPDVTLLGGGNTNVYLGSAGLGANTSGALTKLGSGALQLTGTNTYGGGTIINNGLLAFASTNALPSTGVIAINTGGALGMTGAYANVTDWLTSGKITTNSTGALALGTASAGTSLDFTSVAGGVYSNLYVGALVPVLYTGTLKFYNDDYRLGGGGGTLALTNALTGNSLTIGATGVGGSMALEGALTFGAGIAVNSNGVLSLPAATASALTLNGGTLQVRGTTFTSLPSLNATLGGGSGFDINNAGNTFTVAGNLAVGGALNKAGAGTLVLGGSNNIAGNVTIAAGALRITNNDALDGAGSNVTVVAGAALQLQGGVTTEVGDLLTLNGTGVANDGALRSLAGSNTWSGPVTLGSATRINADADLLTLAAAITNGPNLLTFGGAGNILLSGSIVGGAGNVVKDGAGTLTLIRSNTFSGATFVNGGTLVLDFSAAGAPLTNMLYSGVNLQNLNMGAGTFKMISSSAALINTQYFNSLVLDNTSSALAGNSTVIATNTGAGASILIFTNSGTRAAGGGVVNFVLPGGSGRISMANPTNSTGTMSTYITVGGSDWAALGANNSVLAFTGYTNVPVGGTILSATNTMAANVRIVDSGAGSIGMAAGTTTIQSLSVTNTGATTLNIGAGNTLRLSGSSASMGGLLLAPGSGGLTIGTGINSGSLTAGFYTNNAGSELVVFQNSANDLTVNSAIVNNGTGAAILTIAGTGTGAVNLNGTNSFTGGFYINSGRVTLSNTNGLLGGLTMRGGTLTFSSTSSNTLGAVTLSGNSVMNINGPTTNNVMSLGVLAGDRAVLVINANANMQKMLIGNASGTAGAVIQNGGNVQAAAGVNSTDALSLGINGGYGYYQMNAGTLLTGQLATGGGAGAGDIGVYEQYGGTTTVAGGGWLLAGGWSANSKGLFNVFGGTLIGPAGNPVSMSIGNNPGAYGMINMLGGTAVLVATNNVNGVNMFGNTGSTNSIFNLNAGTLIASKVYQAAAGPAQFDFNGGTLQAQFGTTNANFFALNAGGAAYVYGGGAVIDSTNSIITIAQNLVGVTGFGVTNIALAANGAGYVGAPFVVVSGGSGTGMSAIAQGDFTLGSPTYGQITNLLVTSAGSGYLPTDALTVQLFGGGYTTAAVPGAQSWAANLNTGGLTKNGTGTLTLTGTNSYGGTTVINNGLLVFQPAATATNVIGGLGGAGAVQHNGLGMTVLNGDSSGFTGSATVNTGVLQFATVASVPTTAAGGILVNNAGTVAFDFAGGAVQGALANLNATSPGVVALTVKSTGETVNFNTPGLTAAYLGAVGTVSYDLAHHTPAVPGVWKLGGGGGTLNLTNTAIGGADSVTIGNGANGGTVIFNAANTYSGATTVNAGGILRAGTVNAFSPNSSLVVSNGAQINLGGFNQAVGSLAGGTGLILNTNSMAVLTVGGDNSSTLFGGGINGAISLTKTGAGTLTLTNLNAYIGATLINAGTLQLAPTGPNQAGLTEAYALGAQWEPVGLTNLGVQTSLRFANINGVAGNYPPVWNGTTWPTNTTIGYNGYVYNNSGTNVTWTFAANCDDNSKVYVDGVNIISTTGNAVQQFTMTLTPGAHLLDVRLYNNGGNGGANYTAYSSGSSFVIDPLGRGTTITANYLIPVDPGNGSLFTTGVNILPAAAVVQIASGATLDLNGAQQYIAGLSDPFGSAGLGGFVTNSQAAIPSTLTLNLQAGSNYVFTGDINDAGAANAITLALNGPGMQTLAGTNTYSGGTLINTGVVQFSVAAAVSPNSNILVNVNGAAAFDYAAFQNSLASINKTSAGSIALTTNSAAANLDFNALSLSNAYLGAIGNVNYSGTYTNFGTVMRLGGGGGTLTYGAAVTNGSVAIGGGPGTVILGNLGNSYTGTVLNAGILQVAADTNLGAFVAGATNILFNGGTLQAGGNLALDANRIIAVASNTSGTLDDNGFTLGVNGSLFGNATTSVLNKVGSGTLVLGGVTTAQLFNVRSGTLTFGAGSSTYVSSNLVIGAVAGDRATMLVNTNVTAYRLQMGNDASSAGAIYQTGGVLNQTAGANFMDFALGNNGTNSYGYYKITGGTMINNEVEVGANGIANSGGNGVFEMYGGTVSNVSYFLIGRNNTSAMGAGGVVNVFGGTLNHSGANNAFGMGWNNQSGVFAMLNVFSNAVVNVGTRQLFMNNGGNAGNFAYLNLNGGTTIVGNVQANNTSVQVVGFNGGVLKASNGTTFASTFLQGMTAAYVYPNGAIVDDSGQSITINQNLVAPTGYGVTNVSLGTNGAGYIGAPLVRILGGSGVGATAIAQADLTLGSPTFGQVTNLLVTSVGSGYLPGDVLTVQLQGGGMTTTATVGAISLGLNASLGGLTKLGAGTLTLGGNNTYNGATVVSNGNFQLGSGGASGSLVNPSVTFLSTNSWLGFGRSDLFTNSLAVQTPNGNLTQLVQNGSGLLVLTNTTLNFNQVAVSNGVVWFAAGAVPTNNGANSLILAKGGGVAIGGGLPSVTNLLAGGLLANNSTAGTLALMTGGNTENINMGAYTNIYVGAAPGQTATLLGPLTPAAGTTNYLVGGGGGTLIVGQANAFTDLNTLTNRSLLVGVGGPISVVQVLGPQSYSGGTAVSNAVLSVSADNNLGYGNITLNGNGTLQITNAPAFSTLKTLTLNTGAANVTNDISGGSTGTFYNAITTSGGNNVIKWGTGTMILSNAAVTVNAVQRFVVEQGTLIVDSGTVINQTNAYHIIGYNSGANGTELIRGNGAVTLGGNRLIVADQAGSTGTLTLQDNAFMYSTNDMFLGNGGTATVNLNGGVLSVPNIDFGVSGVGFGTLNLNTGGTLVLRGSGIGKGGSTSNAVLVLNGGTLRALANITITNGFATATVGGSSFLDTSNNTVTLNQSFTGAGTLFKQGSGTLVVNSVSNTFASLNVAAGMVQFSGTNGMTPNRTLVIGAGAAAGYTNNGALDQLFLLRVASNSVGTVALTGNNANNLDFTAAGANLTNVSLGAFGATAWTNSGTIAAVAANYRLGGGGGTLVITNNLLPGPGTNLVAFGNGGGGTLVLTGSNTWTTTAVNGGVVRYGSLASMGAGVTVNTGGAVANNGALDTSLFAQITPASAGAFALVANNVAGGINLGAYPNLSLGAANGSWTNDGVILPNGTTYRLGGGGGTLVITNSTTLVGAGTNLVAFSGSNAGTLVLTGTNTYDGGTWIGPLGTAAVATVSLGSGTVTNNGVLLFGSNSGVFTNTVVGSGNLMQNAGTLTLAGANLSTGDTIMQSGATLYLSNVNGQAISGNLTLSRTGASAIAVRTLAPNQLGSNSVLTLLQNSATASDVRYSMQGNNQVIGGLSGVNLQAGNLIVESAIDNSTNMPATLTITVAAGTNFSYGGSQAYLRDSATSSNAALSLVKNGAGMQTLGGPVVNYTGPTTVNAGILALSNTTGFASGVTINGGQLLLATPGATAVTKSVITNNVSDGLGFSGGTAFTIGGLAGSGGLTLWSQTGGGVALSLGNNGVSSTYDGALSDAGPGIWFEGSLLKVGAGTITLTGSNTFYGPTTLLGGALYVGSDVNLGQPHNALYFSGGNLRTTNSFTLNDRSAILTTTSGGFSVDPNTTLTVTNAITGPGSLLKTNTGTLLLAAVSTYTNFTQIQQGTLQLGVNNAIPAGSTLLMDDGVTNAGTLDMNGFSQTIAALVTPVLNQNNNNAFTNTVINLAQGQSLNVVSTAGTNVVNLGTGTHLLMSGAGAFNVNDPNGGILIYGRSNNLAASLGLDLWRLGTFTANVSNLFVAFDNGTQQASRNGVLTLASNNTINAGNLFVGYSTSDGSIKGQMFLGLSNTLNVANLYVGYGKGNGTLTFSNDFINPQLTLAGTNGTRANVAVGLFNQSGSGTTPTGFLMVTNAGASINAQLNQLLIGSLETNGTGGAAGGYGTFAFSAGVVDVNTVLVGRSVSGTTVGSGSGVLTMNGGALSVNSSFVISQKLGSNSNTTGVVSFNGGLATIGTDLVAGGGFPTLTLNGGTLDLQNHNLGSNGVGIISNLNFQAGALLNVAQINNGAPLVKTTAGTLVLSNNAYTGGTTNLLGTLAVGGNSALGTGLLTMNGGTLGVANGGGWTVANTLSLRAVSNTVDTTGGNLTLAGPLTNSGALVVQGANTLTLTASNTYSGGTTIKGGVLQLGDGATLNGYVQGNITNNAQLAVANPFAQTIGGTISGSGSLTKLGAGVLTLTAANTYAGNTTISNGTLQLGINNALPATSVYAGPAGNLDLAGFNQLLTGVDGYLGVVTNSGLASTLTVNLTTTQNFGGTLAGPANFTVQGGGRLYVSGTTSPGYTGNVIVSNATVLVQGTLTTGGLIQVFNGGTLGGTGALGNVQVNSGGTYSPGFSPGTQLVVSLTLNGGLFNETIVSSNNYSRVVAANGFSLALGTTNYLHLALSNYVFENGASYLIVQDNSATVWNGNQFFLSDALSPDNGATLTNGATFLAVGEGSSTNMFRIAYDFDSVSGTTGSGNDILLTVIPEPTTVNLLVLIGAAAGLRRLLRKRGRPQP